MSQSDSHDNGPGIGGTGPSRTVAGNLVELSLYLLLVTGFFLGPLKLLGVSWFSYLGADALAVIVICLILAERLAGHKPLLARSPLAVPIILLIAYCILELANPGAPFIRSVIGLRSWVLYLLFYFVGYHILRTIRQIERLYILLMTLGVLTAAYGIYQWRVGPQHFATWSDAYGRYAQVMWTVQSGGAVFRAFSTFVLPNAFGENMALVMLLAFSVAISPRIRLAWRLASTAAFVMMGIGIAVSGSRGPVAHLLLIGLVAILSTPGLGRRFRLGLIAVLLTLVALAVVVMVVGSTVGERFATIFNPNEYFWKWFYPLMNGIDIARNHPFGMGLGYTAGVPRFINDPVLQELPTANIDSGYGSAAAELGFVGLALFVFLAVRVGMEGLRAWLRLPFGRLRDLLFGPAMVAATYPIVSVIFQPQAALPSSIYSWLLIGMLLKAPQLESTSDANRLLPSTMHTGK